LAETNLNTAYIQPRTLVYSGSNFRTYADNKFDGFQQAVTSSDWTSSKKITCEDK